MTRGTHTLHEVAPNVFAYMADVGGWGWSNAGLIVGGDQGLLVETLFDVALTDEMLRAMGAAVPHMAAISTAVNTHANGDHWYGNAALGNCDIVASQAAAEEMADIPPKRMKAMMGLATLSAKLGPVRPMLGGLIGLLGSDNISSIVKAGPYLSRIFGPFDYRGIETVLPTRTFTGALELPVGEKTVMLETVGTAHTTGDILVFEPESRVLFSGDLLFVGSHPVIWQGPVKNWIAACDRMLEWDPKVVVPGHGPRVDRAGIEAQREYLCFLETETRKRFDRGMDEAAAARDIDFSKLGHLAEPERIIVNVGTVYRELRHQPPLNTQVPCFLDMARFLRDRE